MKSAVLLECDGESVSEIKIKKDFNMNKFEFSKIKLEDVEDIRGHGKIERECDFEWHENTLSVFAFNDGKSGKENKTELPPPLDTQLYFGNIIIIAHFEGKVTELSLEDYEEFYNSAFGGFEDLGLADSERSADEEPNSEDEAFIADEDDEDADDDEEYIINDEASEFSSEEDTDESGEYSVHSENSNEDSDDNTYEELNLKEWSIIDEYCSNIDKSLLRAPPSFKKIFHSFWKTNPEFVKKWTRFKQKTNTNMKEWSKWLDSH